MIMKIKIPFILILPAVMILSVYGQSRPFGYDASTIRLHIKKLKVLGSALYIAAHPDDENTAMLAYLANGRMVRTAYLALTRGEGGQNLIGSETGAALGLLRTQELLAARRIDGSEQFFGGAEDFGYSKSAEETLEKWDQEKVLERMVGIIRSFQPDVIITRFSTAQGGHGHHLSSAILAQEAFTAAADPDRFSGQLDSTNIWQVKRLVWNSWRPETENRDPELPPLISTDLGTYDPLLGKSYLELAAESRSMHKSQGFGSSPVRGSYLNYFEHTAGVPAREELFDDIDLTWNRVNGGAKIDRLISSLEEKYDPDNPAVSIPVLLNIKKAISALPPSYWKNQKLFETNRLIRMCSGLWLDVRANDYAYVYGDTAEIEINMINRSNFPITVRSASISILDYDTLLTVSLANNTPFVLRAKCQIPEGIEENFGARVTVMFDTIVIAYDQPIRYFWTDRVKGEQFRPVKLVPPVTAAANGSVLFFGDDRPRQSGLTINTWKDSVTTSLSLSVPPGWRVDPVEIPVSIDKKYGELYFPFTVYPAETASTGKLKIVTNEPLLRHQIIAYDHIPAQIYLSPGELDLVRAPLKIIPLKIGYIMGSGDELPADLQQIGYQVSELSDVEIEQDDLSVYDVLIAGTRAFNTRQKLHLLKDKFMQFVENGGTFIVLHNTRFGLQPENIGPYPFDVGRDRVSVEEAPVNILQPDHRLLTYPNRISQTDFNGWIQERGLYFASNWDARYQTIISSNDPGEEPKAGGLLYTAYGQGHFIYAAYSWFRQLPAGVSGAYKLFINLISVGVEN